MKQITRSIEEQIIKTLKDYETNNKKQQKFRIKILKCSI